MERVYSNKKQRENTLIKRGDVWIADLNFLNTKYTCLQQGLRPVIVISNEKCNEHSSVITIVPLTTRDSTRLPTQVRIKVDKLKETSIVLAEQQHSIDRHRLIKKVSAIDEKTMNLIEKAIRIQLSLENKQNSEYHETKANENTIKIIHELHKANNALNNLDTLTAKKIIEQAIHSAYIKTV